MPTIIDSLIVRLGMDTSDYDKGRKKVREGTREGAKGFNDMAKEATKFLAIIGGTAAITSFARDVFQSSAAIERFSKNIGVSVENITRLGGAAEIAGGSAEGLQGVLDMLSKAQTELYVTGNNSLLPFFQALGISAKEAAAPVNDLLLTIREKIKDRGLNRQTASNLGQMFGIDAGTMNLLLSSDSEFNDLLEWQRKLNKLTEPQAKQFLALQKSLTMLGQTTEAYGIVLLSKAAPAIQTVFDAFASLGEWVDEHGDFMLAFMGTLGTSLAVLAAKSVPISLLAAELLILAGIIGLVYDDYQTFKSGGDATMPWDYWIPKIESAVDWLDKLLDRIRELAYNPVTKILGAAHSLWGAVTGNRKEMEVAYSAGSGSRSPSSNVASGGGDLATKMANAEAAAGLPPGTLAAIRKQETGNNQAYVDNPSKYHYGLDSNGRRVAGHTGKVSTAFGPFGLLESTARDPGYGVAPLKNKSLDEQIRFAAEYTAARARAAGSLRGGLAGYGEGGGYASSVLRGIPGASNAAKGATPINPVASKSVTTSVGQITINTQATDAEGIARDMGSALDQLTIAQANNGLM